MKVSDNEIRQAVDKLRLIYEDIRHETEFRVMFAARDEVIGRYQKVFGLDNLPLLKKEDFLSFLKFENNQHWYPLYRQKTQITSDMDELRSALAYLVNESRPLKDRLDKLRPPVKNAWIRGLGRAIITPILLIMYPNKYGVWNGVSETGMKRLGVWPSVKTTASFSEKYLAINEILLELSAQLELDLWTLDGLWWGVRHLEEIESLTHTASVESELIDPLEVATVNFGRERYLQEFLFDNWDQIEEMREWVLLEDEDEVVGMEYYTNIGRIDLLAKHKTEPKWLVIELKRNQASDDTMGQVKRYKGWVMENLADKNETVQGLIIAKEMTERLKYALKATLDVEFMSYEVSFTLRKPND